MTMNWELVSAVANAVMAATTLVAALYALKQYRHSVRLQEIQQMMAMYEAADTLVDRLIRELSSKDEAEPTDYQLRSILNLLTFHEILIEEKLFSRRVEAFYREFITLGDKIDLENHFHQRLSSYLKENEVEFARLVRALRSREATRKLVDW